MKRSGFGPRKTPLRARKGTKDARRGTGSHPDKGTGSTSLTRARKAKRFKEQFGPPGFVEWMKARPCVKCGKVDWRDGKPDNAVHHDPTRGSGGTWTDTTSMCRDHHTAGPGARHTVGVVTFWRGVGRSFVECNAETQRAWVLQQ